MIIRNDSTNNKVIGYFIENKNSNWEVLHENKVFFKQRFEDYDDNSYFYSEDVEITNNGFKVYFQSNNWRNWYTIKFKISNGNVQLSYLRASTKYFTFVSQSEYYFEDRKVVNTQIFMENQEDKVSTKYIDSFPVKEFRELKLSNILGF